MAQGKEQTEQMDPWVLREEVKISRLTDTERGENNQELQETSAGFIKTTKPGAATDTYNARKAEARRQGSMETWVRQKGRRGVFRRQSGSATAPQLF